MVTSVKSSSPGTASLLFPEVGLLIWSKIDSPAFCGVPK